MKLFKPILLLWLLFCLLLSAQSVFTNEKQIPKTGTVYVMYYLHNTFRCYSCNRIEDLSKKSLLGGTIQTPGKNNVIVNNTVFQQKIKNNELLFDSINIDKEDNKHYLTDLLCKPKFPIIVKYTNGTKVDSKIFDKVWTMLNGDPQKFVQYIQQGAAEFINKQ